MISPIFTHDEFANLKHAGNSKAAIFFDFIFLCVGVTLLRSPRSPMLVSQLAVLFYPLP